MAQQADKTVIILPAYNEKEAIGAVIDEIKSLPIDCDIVVVDNASTDNTRRIAASKIDQDHIIYEGKKGKGEAVKTAFNVILSKNYSYIFICNSDHTYSLTRLPEMIDNLKFSGFSIVTGWRRYKAKGSMPWMNELGNMLLTTLANKLYKPEVPIKDLCTGLWGFEKEVLEKFEITSKGFTLEAEFFINSTKLGYKIGSFPIRYRERKGEAKLKILDGLKIAWFLIKRRHK